MARLKPNEMWCIKYTKGRGRLLKFTVSRTRSGAWYEWRSYAPSFSLSELRRRFGAVAIKVRIVEVK